ncbi:MAG: hypothetical protein N3G21_07730 [Candidatus Hydrogenedentes bacterium]|nr:hypothetical protein [Candidatus Hydrogenedentota bacterium]
MDETIKSPDKCQEEDSSSHQKNINIQRKFYIAILFGFFIFLLYVNTFDNEWVWDDVSSVLIHKHVQDPKKFFQLFREDQHAFGRGQGNFYRPLVSVSFMLDYLLSYNPKYGIDKSGIPNISPLLFHITNTVLHWVVVYLFFLLLLQLNAPIKVALCASVIYGAHPIHTEAVTYISGRADMMSAVFILLSLKLAIKYLYAKSNLNFYLLLTLASFILGLLSKESTTIFPFLLLIVILFQPTNESKNYREKDYFKKSLLLGLSVTVLVGYLVLRSTVLRFSTGAQTIYKTWSEKIIEVGQALAFYLRVMTIPINLHMEQTLENTPWWTSVIGYLFITSLIILFIWAYSKNYNRLIIGIGWFIVSWFPISGIFTLNAPQAEHWMYLPMMGFWLTIFELIHIVLSKRPNYSLTKPLPISQFIYPLVIVISILYSYQTIIRNNDWQNNETIFRNTLLYNPNSARVRYNLAVTYEDLLKDYPSAVKEYKELIRYYERIKTSSIKDDKKMAFLGEEEIEAILSLGKNLYLTGKFYEAINTLAPLSNLIRKKEFIPYALESISIMSKSSVAIGDIKSFQILSLPIFSLNEEKKKAVIGLILGETLDPPSYLAVN